MGDLELLGRYVSHGDKEALSALVCKYQKMVFSVCFRRLGSKADAEDAMQQVFLAMLEGGAKIQNSVSQWLYRCAINVSVSMIRGNRSRTRLELAKGRLDTRVDRNGDTDHSDALTMLKECLSHLDPTDRRILVDNHVNGQTQRNIAVSMGVTQQAVAKRMSKVILRLRQELTSRGVILSAIAAVLLLAKRSAYAAKAAFMSAPSGTIAAGGTAGLGAGAYVKVTATAALLLLAMAADEPVAAKRPSGLESQSLTGASSTRFHGQLSGGTPTLGNQAGLLRGLPVSIGAAGYEQGSPPSSLTNRTCPTFAAPTTRLTAAGGDEPALRQLLAINEQEHLDNGNPRLLSPSLEELTRPRHRFVLEERPREGRKPVLVIHEPSDHPPILVPANFLLPLAPGDAPPITAPPASPHREDSPPTDSRAISLRGQVAYPIAGGGELQPPRPFDPLKGGLAGNPTSMTVTAAIDYGTINPLGARNPVESLPAELRTAPFAKPAVISPLPVDLTARNTPVVSFPTYSPRSKLPPSSSGRQSPSVAGMPCIAIIMEPAPPALSSSPASPSIYSDVFVFALPADRTNPGGIPPAPAASPVSLSPEFAEAEPALSLLDAKAFSYPNSSFDDVVALDFTKPGSSAGISLQMAVVGSFGPDAPPAFPGGYCLNRILDDLAPPPAQDVFAYQAIEPPLSGDLQFAPDLHPDSASGDSALGSSFFDRPEGSSSPVPEPATFLSLLAGALCLLPRRADAARNGCPC